MLFHHISDRESEFTRGLNVTTTTRSFEAALKFLTKHYTPVRLQDVLADAEGRHLPPRPVLVTFDDAYASVAEFGVPLCLKYGVPPVFFVNASCLDTKQWALDNLICYVINTLGMPAISRAVCAITGGAELELHSMGEIFGHLLPTISLERRHALHEALLELVPTRERDLAGKTGLYLTSQQLQMLARSDFEIGNHTYTHVHCRLLSKGSFSHEIDRNKAELEAVSGSEVRSFSLPYGSTADLTDEIVQHLRLSGHKAVFLSESVANFRGGAVFRFDRISAKAETDADLFTEIEVLPRLRAMRNLLQGSNRHSRSDQIQ